MVGNPWHIQKDSPDVGALQLFEYDVQELLISISSFLSCVFLIKCYHLQGPTFRLLTDPVQLGLFYNHRCYSLINLLIQSTSHRFAKKIFKIHSLLDRVRDLTFWNQTLCVTCHISRITRLVSCVGYHLIFLKYIFFGTKWWR